MSERNTNSDIINILSGSTGDEAKKRNDFYSLFQDSPIPKNELLNNLGLYLSRQNLSRILFIHELYNHILDIHGNIVEFGVRWGQNLALFASLRGMYEPYNYNRKIIGFDTFEGFLNVNPEKDGTSDILVPGAYNVTAGYEKYLEKIIQYHESESPISHIRKFELVKGNAVHTIHEYLNKNPETIISLAYFDFDIYEPTKACLEAILPHLTKGSVLAFDELNFHHFPGETIALKEVIGLGKYKIRRNRYNPTTSYIIMD